MDNIFIIAGMITFIFGIIKFIEMRFINKEEQNEKTAPSFKPLMRDILIVYMSSICGIFLLQQIKPMVAEVVPSPQVMAFTDNPTF
jgi:hypothetical protein